MYPDYALKFFLSGTMGREGDEEERIAKVLECRLCSCHGDYVRAAKNWARLSSRKDTGVTKLMLDSGAFTAWSKGKKVEVDELIRTYSSVMELVDRDKVQVFLINLDVIPGSPGVTAGTAEILDAIDESDRNFDVLVKEFGNIVVPVYHQNESAARLTQVLSMADYICASPRNDLPEWTRVQWSEEVHRLLPPGKRTHGLATTGANMLSRVPWWSVDSAAWLYSGAMGKVDVWHEGKWVSINVSQESPDVHNAGKHFDNTLSFVKEAIETRAAYHGITVDQLRTDHMQRKLLNGLEIIEWLKEYSFQPKDHQEGLFDL